MRVEFPTASRAPQWKTLTAQFITYRTRVTVQSNSYNYVGWQNSFVIIVNKDNPITKITLKQLDGIFGSVRDGGWIGSNWHPEMKRGPESDIRTWGQMGLTGEWRNRRISPHGYALRYATAIEF